MIQGGVGNTQNDSIQDIVRAVKDKASGAIILSDKATVDEVAAACALYLGLIKKGKSVYIFSPNKPEFQLIGIDKIRTKLEIPGNNLVISFPYVEGSVDSVDAKIENGRFLIIVSPNQGFPAIDPKEVEFSHSGGTVDFFIFIGVSNLKALGSFYEDNKELFEGVELINIDKKFGNARYGTLNYIDTSKAALSEVIFELLKELEVKFDPDIATDLYAGIVLGTNNFSSFNVKPETFEAVAYLLKEGADKAIVRKVGGVKPTAVSQVAASVKSPFTFSPRTPSVVSNPQEKATVVSTPSVSQKSAEEETVEEKKTTSAPQDWLRPKIFSSKKTI